MACKIGDQLQIIAPFNVTVEISAEAPAHPEHNSNGGDDTRPTTSNGGDYTRPNQRSSSDDSRPTYGGDDTRTNRSRSSDDSTPNQSSAGGDDAGPTNSGPTNIGDTRPTTSNGGDNTRPNQRSSSGNTRPNRSRSRGSDDSTPNNIGGDDTKPTDNAKSQAFYLRIIKRIALTFVAIFVCVAAVSSKVSLVSITARMYNLTSQKFQEEELRSTLFIQLTLSLVIPEVVSFIRCLVWGVIGKTTKSFPWPSRKALIGGLITSSAEVCGLCAFVFGVACKLPPSLTLLMLNGCFCYPIAHYLMHQTHLYYIKIQGYKQLSPQGNPTDSADGSQQQQSNDKQTEEDKQLQMGWLEHILTVCASVGFLLQLFVPVGISVLLSMETFFSPSGKTKRYIIATYILIPVTLYLLSIVWSGWIQEKIMQPSDLYVGTARYKTGLINSAIKIFLIPFVSYGCAVLLLDLKVQPDSKILDWNHHEVITFLSHVFGSYLTYLFAWIACALQPWAFFVPMLLSTPLSFVWYLYSVEANEIFPFTNEYFIGWNLNYAYVVLLVAFLLYVSQFLAFSYHIFQRSDQVLTRDSDLFWMPRYNNIFLEQQLVLNRKNALSGHVTQANKKDHKKILSMDNFIFICSTMYHETEIEMKQLLKSLKKIAEVGSENTRHHKFESHIFFDNACSDEQLSQWSLQLLGLLEDTLGINSIDQPKIMTPYGIQLRYKIKKWMPFYVHLKDNNKVKNKKRWSQVMYMKYVLHRIKQSETSKDQKNKICKDKAFILTTDADIEFTTESVIALLDILARDRKVGAVCARTHPLGTGPVVWYQKFDYAIGHWFQKAAEHILGCVLCCPGCFSVFRVSALEKVLDTYSSNVESGFDFLTKDMGEDRWLCTLLIQKGWRLEYSAVSQDSTYCPETFEEFYKQRRRWIPSTMANLALVIDSWKKITSNSNSITILFILYELLMVFSSLISPATVILIIVSGIKGIDHSANEIALVVVFSVISVLYGVVCIYATEKTQLSISKFLTLVFSIVMAVVISGILSDTIDSVTVKAEMEHVNHTNQDFKFPVDINSVYSGIFAVTFLMAGVLHFNEIFCLFHFIWYLLCLPSGYLFLMIYSVCNLNNRSWGTREGTKPKVNSDSGSYLDYFLEKWHSFHSIFRKCIKKMRHPQAEDSVIEHVDNNNTASHLTLTTEYSTQNTSLLDEEVIEWLTDNKCYGLYGENFKSEGYTKLEFIATMKIEDFEAIGIDKRGFLLKLEKEAKKLHGTKFEVNVSKNVLEWLKSIKLEEYEKLFESEGYFSEDVENLKGLTRQNLKDIGITKRAHLNQLMTGLCYLQYPTALDTRINETRSTMDRVNIISLQQLDTVELENKDRGTEDTVEPENKDRGTEDTVEPENKDRVTKEEKFWDELVGTTLKPESANLSKVEELKEKLKNLRNLSVLIIFLINVMWIVFLYTLVFPHLAKYNLPDKAFSLLFLFIFSILVLIQFFAMIFHRFKTMLHLLAGVRPRNNIAEVNVTAKGT